jgi:hypothetical protein
MHKRLLLGLFVCMPVSVPLNGGVLKKFKLWWLKNRIATLEEKSKHPFQLQQMSENDLNRCHTQLMQIVQKLNIYTLRETPESQLRTRAKSCDKKFSRALYNKQTP